jgi:hypothetical protein
MSSTAKRYGVPRRITDAILIELNCLQCDTFSRSSEAVFELSTRFAEPFKQASDVSEHERNEAERLMFLELTQGLSFVYTYPNESLSYFPFPQFAFGEIRPISPS